MRKGFKGVNSGAEDVRKSFRGVNSAAGVLREGFIPGHLREGDRVSRSIQQRARRVVPRPLELGMLPLRLARLR